MLLLGFHAAKSQSHPDLDNFTLFSKNGKVYLTWTISAGQTCVGTQLFRSTDDFNYDLIYQIGGICGLNDRPQTYEYTDEQPILNTVNHYKILLNSTVSDPSLSVIVLDLKEEESTVIPNPIQSDSKVYFENFSNQPAVMYIFSENGTLIHQAETIENFFSLHEVQFAQNGVYYYQIFRNQIAFTSGILTVKL